MGEAIAAGRRPIEVELEPGEYYFCACGRSAKQPFCDGSHKGTGLSPVVFEVDQRERALLCTCKRTANPPFCDGSHHELDE